MPQLRHVPSKIDASMHMSTPSWGEVLPLVVVVVFLQGLFPCKLMVGVSETWRVRFRPLSCLYYPVLRGHRHVQCLEITFRKSSSEVRKLMSHNEIVMMTSILV